MRTIWKTLVLLMILSGSAAALIPLPNAYDRGYYDGCETAKGHYKKAGSLYRHNADYRRGWQQGKRKCASGNHNTGNDHGHHYTYNQGYSDGCKSAKGHWRKNAKAYRKSSQYRQGWNEGFQKCKFGNQHDQGNLFQKGFDDDAARHGDTTGKTRDSTAPANSTAGDGTAARAVAPSPVGGERKETATPAATTITIKGTATAAKVPKVTIKKMTKPIATR